MGNFLSLIPTVIFKGFLKLKHVLLQKCASKYKSCLSIYISEIVSKN